jgi:hypothetical protein
MMGWDYVSEPWSPTGLLSIPRAWSAIVMMMLAVDNSWLVQQSSLEVILAETSAASSRNKRRRSSLQRRWLSSGIVRSAVSQKLADVSECLYDESSKHLWNIGPFLRDYMVQNPRKHLHARSHENRKLNPQRRLSIKQNLNLSVGKISSFYCEHRSAIKMLLWPNTMPTLVWRLSPYVSPKSGYQPSPHGVTIHKTTTNMWDFKFSRRRIWSLESSGM